MATPTLNTFLSEVSRIIRERNAAQLEDFLRIEPPFSQHYQTLIQEIRQAYPRGNEEALEKKCETAIPEAAGGDLGVASWTAFIKFMVQYFGFLRDVDIGNLLETYNQLSELVQKCNSALGHGTFGIVILPTVVSYSRMLARLAIGLDKQPHLIAHLKPQSTDEGGSRETLPERAANIIRQAFTTCLNDRSGAASGVKDGKPDGKKVGIYKIANLCLKVLFQCRKTRNAEQMFVNIDNQSPPLSVYPRGERVTYLYYLGRFLFSTSHFWRAQVVLQRAYDECRTDCVKQRRLIVIYLIASNVILGRFPSNALLQRPESAGLADKFLPICFAIRKGDLSAFRRIFALTNPDASWYLHFRIHLQLQNRCEILVWRSLFRKTFLLNGSIPDKDSRSAPTLGLEDVVRVANYLENSIPKTLTGVDYTDPDLDGAEDDHLSSSGIDMLEVESITTSLLVQGLLGGYVSHRSKKFAILGARQKGALDAGFPNVWQTIKNRPVDQNPEDQVPGWAKEKKRITGGFGPGTVINLSGARAVGSAP